ncbi:MAG TPA: cysteine peptidase family C39 domain-containing protein, partial [Saprospiraceae bacterium]|nr:cysteine peptidase family C39 domain-containing protein [Saprospiraceae bacterium]
MQAIIPKNKRELTTEKLINEAPLPCILHWNENHYVVLFKLEALSNSIFLFNLADPAIGIVKICRNE